MYLEWCILYLGQWIWHLGKCISIWVECIRCIQHLVLLLKMEEGKVGEKPRRGKAGGIGGDWWVGLVRMGSEFSAVILRNLTRGEFSVGTKLPRECNFEKTQRIRKFSGSGRWRS